MNRHELTQEYLKTILSYDPVTGEFTWIKNMGYRVRLGDIAGSISAPPNKHTKYKRIWIHGHHHMAHCLAVLYMTGRWPQYQVDHKNRNGLDNSWDNLREATNSQNQGNSKIRKSNLSGIRGVQLVRGKWLAKLQHQKKIYLLGRFDNKEEAAAAYRNKALELFGEFSVHSEAKKAANE